MFVSNKDTFCIECFCTFLFAFRIDLGITRMRGGAIGYAVLEANAEVNGRGPFSHPTTPKPLNQFRCHSTILLPRPPRELMCKIWLESIQPLRICACVKKHVLCGFFINISICLSVRSFVGTTGHSFGAILTLNGSNDVISQPLVLFGGHINIAPY